MMGNKERRHAGFTMVETLGAIAITVILMAVAFVAVINYRRSMMHIEMDATAKEIYVASQNHLSAAYGQGLLRRYNKDESLGVRDTTISDQNIYYFMYQTGEQSSGLLNKNNSALGLMLPLGAIEETVRFGGSYIIRYQPAVGKVLDVFYAKPSGLGGLFGSFGALEFDSTVDEMYSSVVAAADEWDENGRKVKDNSELRISFGDTGAVLGYYGGEEAGAESIELDNPVIRVENGDVLKVTIENPRSNLNKLAGVRGAKLRLILTVTGTTSGASMYFDLTGRDSATYDVVTDEKYEVTLDDVTSSTKFKGAMRFIDLVEDRRLKNRLFKEGVPNVSQKYEFFIPGENLTIQASVTAENTLAGTEGITTLVPTKYSEVDTKNSLFEEGSNIIYSPEGMNTVESYDAKISSFRHFINLEGDTKSYFNYDETNGTRYSQVTATQVADMSWPSFTENTGYQNTSGTGANAVTTPKPLSPVSPQYVLEYTGREESAATGTTLDHSITGVLVDQKKPDGAPSSYAANAGLFGTLIAESVVQNLELIDFSVSTEVGNAGALAGEVGSNTKIENVLVRNSSGSITSNIKGSGSVGGLVGAMSDGSQITQSAASVYVEATANNGVAGGLVGSVSGGSITKSYSAGHTNEGKYDSNAGNISSEGTAGGLVGSIAGSNASIEYCYSTCSVSGSTAGGMVGSSSGGLISKSYVTGLVIGKDDASQVGAFAGTVDDNTTLSEDQYLSIVNNDMQALSSGDSSGVVAADTSTTTYQQLSGGTAQAYPYDSEFLNKYYNGVYPYKSITQIEPTGEGIEPSTGFVTKHYGDWPSYETFVVNTKSS